MFFASPKIKNPKEDSSPPLSFNYFAAASQYTMTSKIVQLEEKNKQLTDVAHQLNAFYNKSLVEGIDITDNNRETTVKICQGKCSWFIYCDTHSMSPTFTCNDELHGFKPAKHEINVGDILIYENDENRNILHRVIGMDGDHYIMKGDNNERVDDYAPTYSDVIFKITRIDYK